MSTESTQFPLNLYKANLDLQLRIAGLLQESAKKWLELGKDAIDANVAESTAEAERLLNSRDWRKFASGPGEAFWQQLLLGIGDAEAATKTALEAQTSFVAGLQDALQKWQNEVADVMGGAGASFGPAWSDLLKQWGWQSSGAPAAAPAAKQGANEPAGDKNKGTPRAK